MEKRQSLPHVVLGRLDGHCHRMQLEPFLTPYTKLNSKCTKDLNVRPDALRLLEENIGHTLSDMNHSNVCPDPPPRGMTIQTKIKYGT